MSRLYACDAPLLLPRTFELSSSQRGVRNGTGEDPEATFGKDIEGIGIDGHDWEATV